MKLVRASTAISGEIGSTSIAWSAETGTPSAELREVRPSESVAGAPEGLGITFADTTAPGTSPFRAALWQWEFEQHLAALRKMRHAPSVTQAPASEKPKPPSDTAVREWMRRRVQTWPEDTPPPTEEQDREAAIAYFGPGLSRAEIRLIRREETPPKWHKPGPRRPKRATE
jgi:hypothetical protein